jgi:hypothetical protein
MYSIVTMRLVVIKLVIFKALVMHFFPFENKQTFIFIFQLKLQLKIKKCFTFTINKTNLKL